MSDDASAPVEGISPDPAWDEPVWEPEVLAGPWDPEDDLAAEAIAAVAAGEAARAALIEAAPVLDQAARDLIRDVDASQDVTEAELDAHAATDPEGPRAATADAGRPGDTARRDLISE